MIPDVQRFGVALAWGSVIAVAGFIVALTILV
jgi:hypothetical protein